MVVHMKDIDYAAPTTLAEAVALLAEKGDRARVLAGGTDIIVQVREHRRDVDLLVDVKHIPELNELTLRREARACVSAPPCRATASTSTPEIAKAYPGLIDAASLDRRHADPEPGQPRRQPVQRLAGRRLDPAADRPGGVCVIAGPEGTREVPVEQFCTAPGKTVLGRGELLVQPAACRRRKPNSGAAYLRFIPRNEMDIAVVGAGVSVALDDAQDAAARPRGSPWPPSRRRRCSCPRPARRWWTAPLSDALIDKAAALAQAAARPISDMRGDAEYRRHLVGVLVKRALRDRADAQECHALRIPASHGRGS